MPSSWSKHLLLKLAREISQDFEVFLPLEAILRTLTINQSGTHSER
jgi:hypothetical protein